MVDLLRHTSGLTYGFQNRSNVDAAYREGKIENWHGNLDLDGFVAALGKLPLEFSPGDAWNYSVSTDVLGAVVQRVVGHAARRFLPRRASSRRSGWTTPSSTVPADKLDRLTDCYTFVPGKGRVMYDRGAEAPVGARAEAGLGRRRAGLDRARLSPLLPDAAERRRAGRRAHPGRKTIDLMTMQPPARRRGPRQHVDSRCSARRPTPAPASAWASRSTIDVARDDGARARSANFIGAGCSRPPSSSIRSSGCTWCS